MDSLIVNEWSNTLGWLFGTIGGLAVAISWNAKSKDLKDRLTKTERLCLLLILIFATVEFLSGLRVSAIETERDNKQSNRLAQAESEVKDLNRQLAGIDPIKNPPTDLSARVSFKIDTEIGTVGETPKGRLLFNRPGGGMPRQFSVLELQPAGPLRKEFAGISSGLYVIEFVAPSPQGWLALVHDPGTNSVESLTNKLECAEIRLSCFPTNGVLFRGSIELFAGGLRVIQLPIPQQKTTDRRVRVCMEGEKPVVAEYWWYETNGTRFHKSFFQNQ